LPTTWRGWCSRSQTTEFKVTVDLVAEMAVYNPFDFFLEPEAENFPFAYAPELAHDLAPYLAKAPATPLFKAFVDSVPLTTSGAPSTSWSR
jgi:transglutaminase-like putative cysteine protease